MNTYYPGLKIDVSEYNWGAEGNMNGATAQADIVGIFGRQGPGHGQPLDHAGDQLADLPGDEDVPQLRRPRRHFRPDQRPGHGAEPRPGVGVRVVAERRRADGHGHQQEPVQLVEPDGDTAITLNLANFAHGSSAQLWQLAATNPANQTAAAISAPGERATSPANSVSINVPNESVSLFVIPAGDDDKFDLVCQPGGGRHSVTFTATVGSTYAAPSGTVTFMDGATVLGTGNLERRRRRRTRLRRLVVGSHNITAVYAATGGFAGSTSSAVNQVVAQPTTVSGIQVNDGSAQRSEVRSITVTFSTAVSFSGNAAVAARISIDARARRREHQQPGRRRFDQRLRPDGRHADLYHRRQCRD